MNQHFHNALAVARFLESDSRVEKVIFPGRLARLQSGWRPGVGLDVGTAIVRVACTLLTSDDSQLGVCLGNGPCIPFQLKDVFM